MSPSSVQRVHPLYALTPLSCRSFLSSLSRLLTCAVNAPYLSFISLHFRWSLLHVIHLSIIHTTRMQSLYAIFLVPMPSLLSVTLLPRLPLPFGLSVSYPPFYPNAATHTCPSPAYRIPYIVSSLDLHSKKRLHFIPSAHHYISWTLFPPICFVRFDLSSLLNFCSLGSEHREREKMK